MIQVKGVKYADSAMMAHVAELLRMHADLSASGKRPIHIFSAVKVEGKVAVLGPTEWDTAEPLVYADNVLAGLFPAVAWPYRARWVLLGALAGLAIGIVLGRFAMAPS